MYRYSGIKETIRLQAKKAALYGCLSNHGIADYVLLKKPHRFCRISLRRINLLQNPWGLACF
jgi:hypothetical protein